jgi:hypothetical protein
MKHLYNRSLTCNRWFPNRYGFWEEGVVWRTGFGAAGRELFLMFNCDQFNVHALFWVWIL